MPERPPARLMSVFESFAAAGLEWCVLRPAELLAQPQGDIDLLVAPQDLDRAAAQLRDAGFVSLRADPMNAHALDHDDEHRRFLWIHLQAEIHVADAVLPAHPVLAQTRRASPPQLPDRLMFWTLLLRGLIEKQGIPPRQRPHVQRLAAAAGSPPPELARLMAVRGWAAERLVALAAAGSWEALDSLARRPAPSHARQLAGRLVRMPRRLVRIVRPEPRRGQSDHPPGLSVAILGPDGAGKTTLAGSLSRSLPFPTRIQYLGLTGGQIPRAEALRLPGIVFAAKLAILWFRYLRGRYHQARGEVVLFERYVLDAAVPSGIKLRPVARASRRLLQWALPLPDVVLLLDASGSTMHRRSGEYDAAELERWRLAFRRLQRSVRQLEVIDAERPADVVLRDAEGRIWRHYRPILEAA